MDLAVFNGLTQNDWFLMGLFFLAVALILYRPRLMTTRERKQTGSPARVREEFDQNAREAVRNANRVEVKLFEYEREVEGRMQTRLAVLDQLILESEQKINLLQKVLVETRVVQEQQRQSLTKGEPTRGEIQIFESAPQNPVPAPHHSPTDLRSLVEGTDSSARSDAA